MDSRRRLLSLIIAISGLCLVGVDGQHNGLGDDCNLDIGGVGTCKRSKNCPYVQELIKNGGRPQVCYFDRNTPVVCCPSSTPTRPSTRRPTPAWVTSAPATTSKKPQNSPALKYGDACVLDTGASGICRTLRGCPGAARLLPGRRPKVCFYSRNVPIVCCPTVQSPPERLPSATTQRTILTTKAPWMWKPTTRRYKPTRAPIPRPTTNGKSRQKCKEYAKAVFKVVQDPVLLFEPDSVTVDQCAINDRLPAADGSWSRPNEFPHMAALGYGDPPKVDWLCGGSLISDQFVLTAASCIYSKDRVQVKWVRFGSTNPNDRQDVKRSQTKSVGKIITHPRYKPTSFYHDIALLKLKTAVKFDATVRPACLNVAPLTPLGATAVASGWGASSGPGEKPSQDLMKFRLKFVSPAKCNETFKFLISARGELAEGFAEESMVCVGDPGNKRDTCVGNSGDPLQQVLTEPYCMHAVLGVSSFGTQKCRDNNIPAAYTRVSNYVPWIESIVWP